jgi:hypothetical protein
VEVGDGAVDGADSSVGGKIGTVPGPRAGWDDGVGEGEWEREDGECGG